MDNALFPPGHPDAPPATVAAPPPGMAWGLSPKTGERVLAYMPQPEPQQQPPPPAPDVWPKRMACGGGAVAAVIAALGLAGPGLNQAGHAVEMAGVGVGIAAAGTGALVLLVKGSMSRKASSNVNVHVNVTAHGGNANASAKSRSRR